MNDIRSVIDRAYQEAWQWFMDEATATGELCLPCNEPYDTERPSE